MNLKESIIKEKKILAKKATLIIQEFVDKVGLTPYIEITTTTGDRVKKPTISCNIKLQDRYEQIVDD